jgi:hypothetical protein
MWTIGRTRTRPGRTALLTAPIAGLPIAGLAALLACGGNQQEAKQPSSQSAAEPPASAPTAEPEAMPPEPASEPVAPAPAQRIDDGALNRLVAAVRPLGDGAMDESHHASVEALRALAGALAALPAADLNASNAVEETAERLANSQPTSLEHADLLKQGLMTGLSAFQTREPPPQHKAEYDAAQQKLQQAVGSINVDRPLLQQKADVARAFRAATNMVAIAGNATAPFAASELGAG